MTQIRTCELVNKVSKRNEVSNEENKKNDCLRINLFYGFSCGHDS